MAIESKRGCGYRKIDNLYFVTDAEGYNCDRLPIPVTVCPCCGEGIKFSRGFTWIQPTKFFGGDHSDPENNAGTYVPPDKREAMNIANIDCECPSQCPACWPLNVFGPEGKAGLMWVGKKHYSVESFMKESASLGISKRINAIPREFRVGKTWIFLAHKEAVDLPPEENDVPIQDKLFDRESKETKQGPGIFMAFRPRRIERIVKQSDMYAWEDLDKVRGNCMQLEGAEACNNDGKLHWEICFETALKDYRESYVERFKRIDRDKERGITLVPVPDDDPDHAKG